MTKEEAHKILCRNILPCLIGEWREAISIATKALEAEPHWIPVTEATPTEDDDYWCTFGAETGWFVDWCSWYKGQWVVWLDSVPNPVSNVIAWCKPLEPYKGATDGRD